MRVNWWVILTRVFISFIFPRICCQSTFTNTLHFYLLDCFELFSGTGEVLWKGMVQFFVIFSYLVHLPSLNKISFLWYCLSMERFVLCWHFFPLLLALRSQHFLLLQAVYLAFIYLFIWFFFLSKAPPFCSPRALLSDFQWQTPTVRCCTVWSRKGLHCQGCSP